MFAPECDDPMFSNLFVSLRSENLSLVECIHLVCLLDLTANFGAKISTVSEGKTKFTGRALQ